MWGNILSSARKLRDSAADAIREGVQIVDEDDEWEEHHPTNTNRKLSPEFSFPRPPAAAKDSFDDIKLERDMFKQQAAAFKAELQRTIEELEKYKRQANSYLAAATTDAHVGTESLQRALQDKTVENQRLSATVQRLKKSVQITKSASQSDVNGIKKRLAQARQKIVALTEKSAKLEKQVDGSEALREATASVAEAKRVAHQVFQDADKDKNGFLTKSEIRKYFKKHPTEKNRILGSDFQWNEFFTNMDKNGDNKFDVNEFTDFITRPSKLAEAGKAAEAKKPAVKGTEKGIDAEKSIDANADSPLVVALKDEIKRLKASESSVVQKLKQAAQSHKKMMAKFKKQREERKAEVGELQAKLAAAEKRALDSDARREATEKMCALELQKQKETMLSETKRLESELQACKSGISASSATAKNDENAQIARLEAKNLEQQETIEDLELECQNAEKRCEDEVARRQAATAKLGMEIKRLTKEKTDSLVETLAEIEQLKKEKYQLAKEQEIIAKQFEQQRIKAAEVGKLTRAYEALEKHQQQRLSEIKKTDLAIIQTVRENSARETVELRKRLAQEEANVKVLLQQVKKLVATSVVLRRQRVEFQAQLEDRQRQIEIGKTQVTMLSNLLSETSANLNHRM